MSILKIATIGHPVLREKARPIGMDELATPQWQRFIDNLVETMRDADGAGLAANQVYVPIRICAVEVRADNPRYPEKEPIPLTVMVNPVITPQSDKMFESFEGCLSIPDLRGKVARHHDLRVDFHDRYGEAKSIDVSGIQSVTYQHEVDHLNGILFVDKVSDKSTFTTWKNYRRHHRR